MSFVVHSLSSDKQKSEHLLRSGTFQGTERQHEQKGAFYICEFYFLKGRREGVGVGDRERGGRITSDQMDRSS